MTAKTRATRAGFTLVEMLMVIAIIAILAALLFTGISRVRKTAQVVQARNDITQLETVATRFKQDFGFYPPSHVTLTSLGGTPPVVARFKVPQFAVPNTANDAQNDASFNLLQRMFPRWSPTVGASNQITYQTAAMTSLAGQPLSPNQSLVLFLAGPALNGWQTAAPEDAGTTSTSKKGPYFDFPQARIVGNEFVDPWGTPYAYFAASGDSYSALAAFPWPSDPTSSNLYPTLYNPASDPAAGGTFTAHPYRSGGTSPKWMNPGKCQIISAGPNKLFGPGTYIQTAGNPTDAWNSLNPQSGTAAQFYGEKSQGEDDLANFNEGTALGTSNAP